MSLVQSFNTFAATDELSHQVMCIVSCHWRVYSSFSTCNSARQPYPSTTADNQLAPRQN